jgi:hypothetical protein
LAKTNGFTAKPIIGLSSRYRDFWKSLPPVSYLMFLAGVFFMFLPAGLLNDVSHMGTSSLGRVIAEALFSGALAVSYPVVYWHRPRWLPLVAAVHLFVSVQVYAHAPQRPVPAETVHARLTADARGIIVSLVTSFVFLTRFVRREGTRYVRLRTEIALASDIHRLLPRRRVRPWSRRRLVDGDG